MNALLTLTWMTDCTSAQSGGIATGAVEREPTYTIQRLNYWFDTVGSAETCLLQGFSVLLPRAAGCR
jgi:hypothetical protein